MLVSNETYGYDNTRNRTNAGYATGDHNQLLSNGTFTYDYDNEGNHIRRTETATGEVTEYSWDFRNRLTQVVAKDSSGAVIQTVESVYDVYDRRLAKIVDTDGAGPLTILSLLYSSQSPSCYFLFPSPKPKAPDTNYS